MHGIECGSNGGGLLVTRTRRCAAFHFEPCVMGYVCFDFIDCLRKAPHKRPKHTWLQTRDNGRDNRAYLYIPSKGRSSLGNCGLPSSASTRRCPTPRPRRRNKAQKFEAFFF